MCFHISWHFFFSILGSFRFELVLYPCLIKHNYAFFLFFFLQKKSFLFHKKSKGDSLVPSPSTGLIFFLSTNQFGIESMRNNRGRVSKSTLFPQIVMCSNILLLHVAVCRATPPSVPVNIIFLILNDPVKQVFFFIFLKTGFWCLTSFSCHGFYY